MNKKALVLLLLYTTSLYPAFSKNTFVCANESSTQIQKLSKHHNITGFNLKTSQIASSKLQYLLKIQAKTAYQIDLPDNSIICSKDQLFYDPKQNLWIPANALSKTSCFLGYSGNFLPCLAVRKVYFDTPETFYEISLHKPHTFFVSKSKILTHNAIPLVIGLTWAFGQGITLTGAGFGLGALGFGLWQKFGKKRSGATFAQIQKECGATSFGGAPNPDDDDWKKQKVNNMYEFFETKFGQQTKESVEKTSKRCKGRQVYKVTKKIPNCELNEGDLFYLDSLHKDHLEVCGKNHKIKLVLNLDGTKNPTKTKCAFGRPIYG